MNRELRRLAAIAAADVVGYSRLMGRDESGTLSRLRAHRTERLEPIVGRRGGRIVKLTGDGALVEFSSAVDAVAATIEFQQAMAEVNRDQPEITAIVFRIGVHLGDMIVEGEDLYGDGVNVAARLEAEAPPGGIVISGDVHNAIAGRLSAAFDDLGNLALKNIERPVRAYRTRWSADDWPAAAATPAASSVPLPLPDKPSIAVLPFQNMSGDAEQEYFADGMVEDIITALSRFKSLFVIARNSSFAYKGKSPDIRDVGRDLGVRYVLEGSVRKSGGRVRITTQLINAETGAHLWADRIDGALDDIFELQDQVTASVVGAIAPKVDQAEIERVKRKPAENIVAYDWFLRGMALSYEESREAREEALRIFYRALEMDPGFASAHGMAAHGYAVRKANGWIVDREWEEAETRRLALRVSAIGQDDSIALCRAGFALHYVCRDYDTSAALMDQALFINPNLAIGWSSRGFLSLAIGQHQAAIEQASRSLRLSPLDPARAFAHSVMASGHLMLDRYADAADWATRALAQRPDYVPALLPMAAASAFAGNVDEARRTVGRILKLIPTLRASHSRSVTTYRRAEDWQKLADGLRLAGLPE